LAIAALQLFDLQLLPGTGHDSPAEVRFPEGSCWEPLGPLDRRLRRAGFRLVRGPTIRAGCPMEELEQLEHQAQCA
jgi:hypothetical protein